MSAKETVAFINKILYENVTNRFKSDKMMTFTALRYDENGKFTYSGAHLDLIIYRQKTKSCELINTTKSGGFLNFIEDISFASKNFDFSIEKGDILFPYPDGIIEARNSKKELLDMDGFLNIIEKNIHKPLEDLKESIVQETLSWCNHKLDDDLTIVIIKRRED